MVENKPRRISPVLAGKFLILKWWPETGLNRRRRPFQGRALPLSYLASVQTSRCNILRGFRHGRRVRVSQGSLAATTDDSIATRRSARQGGERVDFSLGLVPRSFCAICGAFLLRSGLALKPWP